MDLEFKGLELEIKNIDDKGFFRGIASPFGNKDLGNDRIMPSIATRNQNKKNIPYLWQHNPHEPIGKVNLIATGTAIEVEGKLFLDTNDHGIPLVPNAYKAYVLMKNGQIKNSIGYKTLEYEYVKEQNETIRNLKDIDIMEVSAVTFPMNPKAQITDVKTVKGKGSDEDLELKEEVEKLKEKIETLLEINKKQIEQKKIDNDYGFVKEFIQNLDENSTQCKELYDILDEKIKLKEKSNDLDLEFKEALEELYKTITCN